MAWKRAARRGRQRGRFVYVPAAELLKLKNIDPDRPIVYRVRALRGGKTVSVSFRHDA